MTTPPTFTEEDARTMLDDAYAHTLDYNADTRQYVCTIQLERSSPAAAGSGPRMQDAVWAAVQAVLGAARR
jgi:hypothetical protein